MHEHSFHHLESCSPEKKLFISFLTNFSASKNEDKNLRIPTKNCSGFTHHESPDLPCASHRNFASHFSDTSVATLWELPFFSGGKTRQRFFSVAFGKGVRNMGVLQKALDHWMVGESMTPVKFVEISQIFGKFMGL